MTETADVLNVELNESSDGKQPIRIRRNDRVLFVGKTGSGKTTLAKILLRPLPYIVVLDPKHQFSFETNVSKSRTRSKSPILTTARLSLAEKWDEPYPIVYQPNEAELKNDVKRGACADFWDWIWYRQNTIVYVDEVIAVTPAVNMARGYLRAIQMGRERNIGVWSATQRPARIPQNLISETEHFFCFELRNPNDLERVADFSDPLIEREPISEHDCWYYSVREGSPRIINANQIRIGKKNGRG